MLPLNSQSTDSLLNSMIAGMQHLSGLCDKEHRASHICSALEDAFNQQPMVHFTLNSHIEHAITGYVPIQVNTHQATSLRSNGHTMEPDGQ